MLDDCISESQLTRRYKVKLAIERLLGGPDNIAPLIFVLFGGLPLTWMLIWVRPSVAEDSHYKYETIIVILATILLAGLLQVLSAMIRWWTNHGQRQRFRTLFGTGRIYGIVPDLLAPKLEPTFAPHKCDGARPTGTKVVPFDDLTAGIALAELFESFGNEFRIVRDPHFDAGDPLEHGAVAIGLGFNSLTAQLSATSGLFNIVYADGKDDFTINGRPHPAPSDARDFALIVRVPSTCRDEAVRPALVCAGRCASGTAAAGLFIKYHWRMLYGLYVDHQKRFDADSLAVELEYEKASLMKATVLRFCFAPVLTVPPPKEEVTSTNETSHDMPVDVLTGAI